MSEGAARVIMAMATIVNLGCVVAIAEIARQIRQNHRRMVELAEQIQRATKRLA